MKTVYKTLLVTLVGASLLAGAAGVYAAQTDGQENDAAAAANAKITLNQAVDIALQQVPGTAAKAEFSNDEGQPLWEVEVYNGTSAFDIEIDANSGNVVKNVADKADQGDDEEDGETNDDGAEKADKADK